MEHSKAIVTIAIGEKYLRVWKQVCEANWRMYAQKHGYDLICLNRSLDGSERAKHRSPAWQKCLILSQDYARQYERIVWVDADILINTAVAPSIVEGVPLDKVGAVGEYSYPLYQEFLARAYQRWGTQALVNYTAQDYYLNRGFPKGFPNVVQAGVLALSPLHHREVLEEVYYKYEEQGGRQWHMEQCPLSFELLRADMVHWMDPRFNCIWGMQEILHYPFLLQAENKQRLTHRLQRKLTATLGGGSLLSLKRACITAVFLLSFFLHFGGSELSTMELVDWMADSWRDSKL